MRVFDSFTEDVQALADWLIPGGCPTVAMESTATIQATILVPKHTSVSAWTRRSSRAWRRWHGPCSANWGGTCRAGPQRHVLFPGWPSARTTTSAEAGSYGKEYAWCIIEPDRLFRMAANSLHHTQTPLGQHLRRMKAKLGPAEAITATAHKIAIVFYTMVKNQVE